MSKPWEFASQAISLAGKERLYERAVAAEAWVIKLQERIVDRDEYISALEDELARNRGALRNLRREIRRKGVESSGPDDGAATSPSSGAGASGQNPGLPGSGPE